MPRLRQRNPGVGGGVSAKAYSGLLTLLAGAYLVFTGPRDLDRYAGVTRRLRPTGFRGPQARRTFAAKATGASSVIAAGRNMRMISSCRSVPTCAPPAAAWCCAWSLVTSDGHGLHMPNNFIAIDHGDGTTGLGISAFAKKRESRRSGRAGPARTKIACSGQRRPQPRAAFAFSSDRCRPALDAPRIFRGCAAAAWHPAHVFLLHVGQRRAGCRVAGDLILQRKITQF